MWWWRNRNLPTSDKTYNFILLTSSLCFWNFTRCPTLGMRQAMTQSSNRRKLSSSTSWSEIQKGNTENDKRRKLKKAQKNLSCSVRLSWFGARVYRSVHWHAQFSFSHLLTRRSVYTPEQQVAALSWMPTASKHEEEVRVSCVSGIAAHRLAQCWEHS